MNCRATNNKHVYCCFSTAFIDLLLSWWLTARRSWVQTVHKSAIVLLVYVSFSQQAFM
jgi:hypothetical protein